MLRPHATPRHLQIKSDAARQQHKVKLLLLGTGESGKSTLFKQMRVLYGTGYSEEERKQVRPAPLCCGRRGDGAD